MTNTPDLIAFVRARLDERQDGLDWDCWETRDIAAKRAIVDAYAGHAAEDEYVMDDTFHGQLSALFMVVKHLAATDADHADYNPEWRLT